MTVPRLQKFKQFLRKSTVFTLVLGMLLTSQGIYQGTSGVKVYASYFEPDCAPNGVQIEGIVASGEQKIGIAGTSYRVKNCGNQVHTIKAQRFSGICKTQSGSCYPQRIADQSVTLSSGQYGFFTVDSPNISCGSAQTDIHPDGLPTGGSYGQVGSVCTTPPPLPTPTPTIRPTPTVIPTITPIPTPVVTPTIRPTPTVTPSTTPVPTPVVTPTIKPTPTVSPSISPTPTSSPSLTTSIIMCKYEDDNGNGNIDAGENKISWTFNYVIDGVVKSATSYPWNILNRGCAIVSVPTNKIVTVSEVSKPGWRMTALYDNALRTDLSTYTYTTEFKNTKTITFTNTFTPNTTPTPSPTVSPTPSISPTPSTTSSSTPTASPTTSPTVSPTPTTTPYVTPTPTSSPSATPSVVEAELKMCKYQDSNSNGLIDNNEKIISWKFNYTINNTTTTVEPTLWDQIWRKGCVIVKVPIDQEVTVSEQPVSNWAQTALYVDGARSDTSNYTYQSRRDAIKVLWFLNAQTTSPTPTPTNSPTPTATPTATPSITPTPTPTNSPTPSPTPTVLNSSYNVSTEKKVDSTRVDGDKVYVQYSVKIKNTGIVDQNNIELRDNLPTDFTYENNSTSGDLAFNPVIQDASGPNDNRRLVWKDIKVLSGKEINFSYKAVGKRTDSRFCNEAQARINDSLVSSSQACTSVSRPSVLAANTVRELPATGTNTTLILGLLLLGTASIGWKLSKHVE
ncbi:MAG: hypothetical protein M3P33_03295 [bacterium]|nr:hypothetical protein [bacterium]